MRTPTRTGRRFRTRPNIAERDREIGYTPRRPSRAARVRKWLLLGAGLLLLAWAAPMIAAHTPLRNVILGSVCSDLNGTVTAGSASLGWFSPVVLTDVEVREPDGNLIAQAKTIKLHQTLLALLTGDNQYGAIDIESPELRIQFAQRDSNLEALLAQILNRPSTQPVPNAVVHVRDGVFVIEDQTNQTRWRIDRFQAKVTLNPDGLPPLQMEASGEVAQPDRASQFSATFESTVGDVIAVEPSGLLTVHADNLPLQLLHPILRRIRPGLEVSGWLTGSNTFHWGEESGLTTASLTGELRAQQLSIRDPSLGRDTLQFEQLQVPCQLYRHGNRVIVQEFNAFSEVGDLQFGGRLEFPITNDWQTLLQALRSHEYDVIARIDLARLARLLPNTLHIRPGTQVESGNVQANLTHRIGTDGMAWHAQVVTTNLTGFNAGQRIVWDRPIRMELKARETPLGLAIDLLHCESDFLVLDAEGTSRSFAVAAEHDLDRLAAELGRFVDLGSCRFGGDGWSYLHWEQQPDGSFEGQYECQIQDFEFTLPGKAPWREPRLLALVKASGSTDAEFKLRSLQSGVLRVESGSERLKATLMEAVPRVQAASAWPLRLDLEGELPQLIARLEPLTGPLPEVSAQGFLRMSAFGTASKEFVTLRQSQAIVDNLSLRTGDWKIDDPQVQLAIDASWNQAVRRAEIGQLVLTGNSFSIDTREAVLDLPLQRAPQFYGTVSFSGDLARLRPWHRALAQWQMAGTVKGTAQVSQADRRSQYDLQLLWKDAKAAGADWTWSEPSISLATLARYDEQQDAVQIDRVQVDSRSLRLQGQGAISGVSTHAMLALMGSVDYDYESLLPLLRPYIGDGVNIALVRRPRPFQVSGPLWDAGERGVAASVNTPAASPLAQWSAATTVDWTAIEAYGFRAGSGEIQGYLYQGTLGIKPFDLAVNNGRVRAEPRIVLTTPRPEFHLEPGMLFEQVEVTEEMCSRGLKYIAPLLANATRPQGRFSLDTGGCRIPLGDAKDAEIAGRMYVHDITITPGPLLHLIAGSINAVRLAGGKTSGFTRAEVARLQRESVINYRLVDGRVYHQNLVLDFDDVTVSTRGSVGLDQSLAIVAHVHAPKLFAQVPALAGLQTQGLEIPIHGTLSQPRIDRSRLSSQAIAGLLSDDNLQRAGGDALQKLLDRGVQELNQELKSESLFQNLDQGLKRLFGPR